MTHPNEGILVALRDGEVIPETDRAHVAACSTCGAALAEARSRADLILDLLDGGGAPVDIGRAKASVRTRLDHTRARPRFPITGSSLGRAAAILLLAAGAVSALQSPPVRSWLSERFAEPGGPESPAVGATVQLDELQSVGVAAQPGLIIALTGVEAGGRVAVVFEVRDEVEVFAAEGTRFSIANNRIDASEVVGPVVIRVPSGAPALTVTANGRMMFTGIEAAFEVDASGVRADGGWVFRAPDP